MRGPLGATARALGTGLVFVAAVGAGVSLHVNSPALRRVVAHRVDRALASTFAGRVTVERIGTLGATWLDGVDFSARDPDGKTVLRLEGVRARVSTFAIVESLLGGGDIVVGVPDISAAHAEVSLDADDTGTLRIARAFAPPPPAAPSASTPRGVRFDLPHVRIGRAWIHGNMSGVPPIDGDVEDLTAALRVTPDGLAVDVSRARATERGLPGGALATGTVRGQLTMPSPKGRDIALSASWIGTVGLVGESARGSFDGKEVDAFLDVPQARPDDLRVLWPSCPFTEPGSLHAEAHGMWPRLEVRARSAVGRTAVEAQGVVTLGEAGGASLHAQATSFDARALSAAAPVSDLSASADVSLGSLAGETVRGEVTMDFAGGTIASEPVPPATLRGRFTHDTAPHGQTTAEATVAVREPGAPADLTLRLGRRSDTFELAFEGQATAPRLDGIPRLGSFARGHAAASARGSLDLGSGRLDADVQASAGDVEIGGARLHEAKLVVHAGGKIDSPQIDADLRGEGLEAGPLRGSTLRAESHGTLTHAPVEISVQGQDARLHARADVDLARDLALRDVAVELEKGGVSATARAPLVSIGARETRVDDAEVDGLGTPLRGTLRQSPGAIYVRAHARKLDLGRIAAVAGLQQAASGRLALDVDALLRANGAQGHVVLDLSQGAFAEWQGAKAHVEATLDGRRVAGKASAAVADLGSIELQSSSIEIGGSDPPSWTYWKRAWGAADADAHVDLAKLTAHLPARALPVGPVAGALDVHAHFRRDSMADVTPDVELTARTTGVALARADGPAQRIVEGVNATGHLQIDGDTGRTAVDGQLADAVGMLAMISATSDAVPFARLFAGADLLDVVQTMPFQAELTLPPRDLETLPAVLGAGKDSGRLQATVRWTGTMLDPTVDVVAGLQRGRADVRVLALPVDLDLTTHYDGAHAETTVKASARRRPVLAASVGLDARAADALEWLRGQRGAVPWTASARARLEGFPLQSLGALERFAVRGKVSGELALDGLHDDAHATLALEVAGLEVGDIPYKQSTLQAEIGGGKLDASLRIDHEDGSGEAHATVGAKWGSALTPSIDASIPADVSVRARQFRVGLLAPLVSSVFRQLDGHVTGDAHLRIDPGARALRPEGTVTLEGGALEVVSLGGQFHDVSATATFTPDGVVRIENVSARGLTGRLEAAATARFDGLGFGGLRAKIQVPKKEPLPFVFDDVQVGTFYGSVAVAADRSADRRGLDVDIDVQSLHAQLPLSSAHDVQTLGSIAGLRVGTQGATGFGSAQPEPAESAQATSMPVHVVIDLGNDVEVKRGTNLDVALAGRPTIDLDGSVRAGGQVQLIRGSIDVQGKQFSLDKGTVTFVGDDPTNPQVALTAKWTAPDGTIVYADFLGPLKTGQVKLRSEPSRSNSEIIALILTGTTDETSSLGGSGQGSSPDSSGQGLNMVGGAAGGVATQPINRMLDNFGVAGGIRTKVDTSSTTPRGEVEVQIARDITLQVAWVLGVPPPGSNPDLTLVTLNWRFLRKWSLQTTVGDAGTSIVDVIWQHRY